MTITIMMRMMMMMMMMMIMFVLLMVMLTICDSQMVDKFVFSLTLDMQFKVHDIIICSNMFQIMLSKVGPNLYVFFIGIPGRCACRSQGGVLGVQQWCDVGYRPLSL